MHCSLEPMGARVGVRPCWCLARVADRAREPARRVARNMTPKRVAHQTSVEASPILFKPWAGGGRIARLAPTAYQSTIPTPATTSA